MKCFAKVLCKLASRVLISMVNNCQKTGSLTWPLASVEVELVQINVELVHICIWFLLFDVMLLYSYLIADLHNAHEGLLFEEGA